MNANEDKDKIKSIFKDLFKMMSEGCGREYCFNSFCSSNPSTNFHMKTKQQIVTIALQEIKSNLKNLRLCTMNIPPKSLQYNDIDMMLNRQFDMNSNIDDIIMRLVEIFSNYEALNMSFYDINHNNEDIYIKNMDMMKIEKDTQGKKSKLEETYKFNIIPNNHNIDFMCMKKVNQLFNKIIHYYHTYPDINQYKKFNNVFFKAMKSLLKEFKDKIDEKLIKDELQLRIIPILLELDCMFDNTEYTLLLLELIKLTQMLDKNLIDTIIKWFSKYNREIFIKLIDKFKNIISLEILKPSELTIESNIIENIEHFLSFYKLLYEANKFTNIKYSAEDFYIGTISQSTKSSDEFIIWLKNKSHQRNEFTFLDYPWILECSFKAEILEIESKTEMSREIYNLINDSITSLLFGNLEQIYLRLKVRRDKIIEDTLNQIKSTKVNYKREMKVQFVGEQGIDEGGVKKEFFQLLTKNLLNPEFGMFVPKENDRYLWFNMNSFEFPLNFELVGILLGLAIYNSVNLDLRFPDIVYKKLLDEKITFKDLKNFDIQLYNGFKKLLEFDGDVENTFYLTFQATYDCFGEEVTYDLKENGSKIFVNKDNREEYIQLYIDWYTNLSIEKQFRPFYKGFYKVVTGDAIKFFTGEELNILICGSPHLDFTELERNTTYEDGYNKDTPVIKWFWEIVHSFSEEQKRKFIFFCTGSDRAPIKGLGCMNFIIMRHGPDSERLPTAHTCFNHFLLPEYSSKEKLKDKLIIAIANSEGFGLF